MVTGNIQVYIKITTSQDISTYIHLPRGHEVCTLPDPLKDLLQLGVNEGVVCRGEEEEEIERLSGKHFHHLQILCDCEDFGTYPEY